MQYSKELLESKCETTMAEQLEIAGKLGRTEARLNAIKDRCDWLIRMNQEELVRSFDDDVEDTIRLIAKKCDEVIEDITSNIWYKTK